jgi:hypothetical protein
MQSTKTLDETTGKYVVLDPQKADASSKYYGRMLPSRAHTMIGMPRLDNLPFPATSCRPRRSVSSR